MNIGNRWIMKGGLYKNEIITFAVVDTTIIKGSIFGLIPIYLFGTEYYYGIDSLGNFYSYKDSEELILFNLNMGVGDSIQIYYDPEYNEKGFTYCLDRKEVTTFIGTQGEEIKFLIDWNLNWHDKENGIILQEGVGPVEYLRSFVEDAFIIKGAIIDNVVYGDTTTTSVSTSTNLKFDSFFLDQNYPNPFNSSTKIRFSLPKLSKVTLKLYNLLGEEVETLINNELLLGEYNIILDSKDNPGGIYFYQLKTEEFIDTKKLIIQK